MDSGGENQDQCGQAGGCPAARYADRYVRTGGVDQPETSRQGKQRTPHATLSCRADGRRYAGVWDMSTNCATCA